MHRPHHLSPCVESARVAICYKNFAAQRGISHIGLGVAALNNVRALGHAGVWAEVWPIVSAADLARRLAEAQARALAKGEVPVSHVVISAPWVPTADLHSLIAANPGVQFAVTSHSNVGFLQADANGVRLLRDGFELQAGNANFRVAGNSRKFADWVERAYEVSCAYLPNMYWIDQRGERPERRPWERGPLRIGCFGAMRPLKNHMSAAGAALDIQRRFNAEVEFWVSGGRDEGGGQTVRNAIRAMLDGVHGVRLIENNWQSWPRFKQTVRHMHLLIQVSYSESFNMVTADGICESVPSVVSDAIDWVPENWQARSDNVTEIARTGTALLLDPHAAREGLRALDRHNEAGLRAWLDYLVPGHGARAGTPRGRHGD